MHTHYSKQFGALLAVLVLVLTILGVPASLALAHSLSAPITTITRVSVDSSGIEGNGRSHSSSISADGRYVAFESDASNLVSGDTNGYADIFLRDTQTGTTARVSVDSSGAQGNYGSYSPSISANGRYVAFDSYASNLVNGDTNGWEDIFLRDTQTGITTRISVDSNETQGNYSSYHPSISADGRYVAFDSVASNLVSGDTNDYIQDIFLRDTQTSTTARISDYSSEVHGNSSSFSPSISADGRYVAFWSYASNLVNGDTNNTNDIFLHDTQTGTTTRVSVDSSGTQGNGPSDSPSISADGRYIAFYSDASNLAEKSWWTDKGDVFLRDMQTGSTTYISIDSNGRGGRRFSYSPSISADGRYVAFESENPGLVSGDWNDSTDVFLRDTQMGTTARISLNSSGAQGSGYSPSISADGLYVAFESYASLVNGDTNSAEDVFVVPATIFNLTVSKSGAGNGIVYSGPNSSPGGIFCGPDCSYLFTSGSTINLSAAPDSSSNFTDWSNGGCSGTGNCVVTMDADKSVTASFELFTNWIYLPTIYNNSLSSPAGITCGPDCSTAFASGSNWSNGRCSDSGDCMVVMNTDKSIAASLNTFWNYLSRLFHN